MRRIVSWEVRRSGAGMTVIGRTPEGQAVKIANLNAIESADPYPIATDANGECYELAFDPVFSKPVAAFDADNLIAA